jgi:predicted O-methyltransferase YrrM
VEADEHLADAALAGSWPPYVRLVAEDGLETLGSAGTFDLVFADAAPIKYGHLDAVLGALRPSGVLVIDDVHLGPGASQTARERVAALRRQINVHPLMASVELDWASGVIVASRTGPA